MQTVTKKKLKLIYIPFLVIAISFIVFYTFVSWLIIINTGTLSIGENIIRYGMPLLLSWIPVLIWLGPRINLLDLTDRNDSGYVSFQLTAALAITIPAVIAQNYIVNASSALTRLETINEIEQSRPAKYYTLKNYYIDKRNVGVHSSYKDSGKHNQFLEIYAYFVLPVFISEADTSNSSCSAWLGFEYSESISNRHGDKEREEECRAYLEESKKDFVHKNVSQFVYLERVENSKAVEGFNEAIKNSPKYNPNHTSVLLAVNEPFENRTGNTFFWIFGSFGITGGVLLFILLRSKFDEDELKQFESDEV